MKTEAKCDTCAKSGLSVALLRPSIVAAHDVRLTPPGAERVSAPKTLLTGLLPEAEPTQSRPVLRMLRQGYLHVYFEKPLAGGVRWQTYHVTERAELIPLDLADMINTRGEVVCNRSAHNVHGLRTLNIPQAHKAGKVWIAFSANQWSDAIKGRNQADPAVMQCIDVPAILGGAIPDNGFRPTAESLAVQVAECGMASFTSAKRGDLSPYRFNRLSREPSAVVNGGRDEVDDWVAAMAAMGEPHPKTRGKQIALVLRDPIALAVELNALRLRRYALAQAEMERPENVHALNSSNALMGLKSVMLDNNLAHGWDKVAPVMSGGAFRDIMRVKPNPRGWPEETHWEALAETRENHAKYGYGMGRVVFPDHERRADEWARRQTEATWSRMAKYYDETARRQWLEDFDKKLEKNHFKPLEAYELDWLNARVASAFRNYFERHFDPSDPSNPRQTHQPGVIYAQEVESAFVPQPLTRGKVLRAWVDDLEKRANAPDAYLLRALVGNQAEVIAASDAIYDVKGLDAARKHLHDERNDKLLDLGKGVVQQAAEGKMGATAAALAKRFGWLSDALGGYATSIAMSATGAVSALGDPRTASAIAAGVSGLAHVPMDSATGRRLLQKVQSIHMVRQALDMALKGVVQGGGLKTPMLIHRAIPIDDAMDLLRGRSDQDMGVSRRQLKRLKRSGQKMITMSVLTDNKATAELGGDIKALIEEGHGEIRLGGASRAQQTGVAAATVILSEEKFIELYRAQSSALAKASAGINEAFRGARAAMRSLDGRLALGVIIINAAGVWGNLNKLGQNAQDAIAVRNAWYGMADASSGVTGGLLELSGVVTKAAMEARSRAPVVVAESAALSSLAAGAYFMGAFAGVVNGMSALAKREDAKLRGDADLARLYAMSALSFGGVSIACSALAAGAIADYLVKRGLGGVAARAIAMQLGAQGTATLLGVSVSGWGLILLGAGLIFDVGAILMTPTPLQNWIRRTYFGTGDDNVQPFTKGDWPAEYAALMVTLRVATKFEGTEVALKEPLAPENSINIAP